MTPSAWCLGVALALVSRDALAQACCAGGSPAQPARLQVHEQWLVGGRLGVRRQRGWFDGASRPHDDPAGTAEQGLSAEVFGTVRLLSHAQVTLTVPALLTERASPSRSARGGGVGDLGAAVRWDLFHAPRSHPWPGLALVGGATLPTGRSAEDAHRPLGVDATGAGSAALSAGVALEETWRAVAVVAMAQVGRRLPRTTAAGREVPGWHLQGLLSASWVAFSGRALGALVRLDHEAAPALGGQQGQGRRTLALGPFVHLPLGEGSRLQIAATVAPLVAGLGRNAPADASAQATLAWGFY